MKKANVILGLGSNLGNRLEILKAACVLLNNEGILFIKSASIYETEAWGFESETSFYNTVIMCETILLPEELLKKTQDIENRLGRTQKSSNNTYLSRKIDIDILFYNDEVINSEKLIIPHPFIQERNFVLAPLNELIPSYIHPLNKLSITELTKQSNDTLKVFIVHFPIFVN